MADWARSMEINVGSMVMMSKYAIPEMEKNEGQWRGSIVNLASVAGIRGGNPHLFYPTSKGAVVVSNGVEATAPQCDNRDLSDRETEHDPSNGSAPWSARHPRQLCVSRHGLHAYDVRNRHERFSTRSTQVAEHIEDRRHRMGCGSCC